jgi:predicted AlkP superfamily pyrophosphatase or phosphodiesterase
MPDLFYTNYKSTDLAGHEWGMLEPEVRDDLKEQDAQLPLLIKELDRFVGKDKYVLALTADHGMQPPTADGWKIDSVEMSKDLARLDKTTPNIPLELSNRGYQYMFNRNEMKRNDLTPSDLAAWIRDYRIEDNATGPLPEAFKDRGDERIFLTALTPDALKRALDCSAQS